MGPYCIFCQNRCFVHFPEGTPQHILDAYGTSTTIATCQQGQEFEKKKVGYCYDDILIEIEAQKTLLGEMEAQAELDHTDDVCHCGEPDCNRIMGHSVEEI